MHCIHARHAVAGAVCEPRTRSFRATRPLVPALRASSGRAIALLELGAKQRLAPRIFMLPGVAARSPTLRSPLKAGRPQRGSAPGSLFRTPALERVRRELGARVAAMNEGRGERGDARGGAMNGVWEGLYVYKHGFARPKVAHAGVRPLGPSRAAAASAIWWSSTWRVSRSNARGPRPFVEAGCRARVRRPRWGRLEAVRAIGRHIGFGADGVSP
jgi:hypothetical protein